MSHLLYSLTPQELQAAKAVAEARQTASEHHRQSHGLPENLPYDQSLGLHLLGAKGEIIGAKAIDLRWYPTVNTFHDYDIPPCIYVRTRSAAWHDLIVRESDRKNGIYVLVRQYSSNPELFDCTGYILGKYVTHDRFQHCYKGYSRRDPAYFIPAKSLQPISELKRILPQVALQMGTSLIPYQEPCQVVT